MNIESLYEVSLLQMPTMKLRYQYGSRAGVWRILRLLKEYGIKCTSYMVGQALLQNPQVGEWMVKEGHEVAR